MKRLAILFALFATAGCQDVVELKDGAIPDAYVADATQFVGTYQGDFEGHKGQLNVSLDSQNHLLVSFADGGKNDLLGGNCAAVVGQLKSVGVSENKGTTTLGSATFAFNPNLCTNDVLGNELEVHVVKDSGKIDLVLSLFYYYELHGNCHHEPPPPAGSGREVCDSPYQVFLHGRFSKSL